MKSTPSSPPRSSFPLLRDERGMSTIEYVILLAVIVVGAVSLWTSIERNQELAVER
jgi:hypothetical protein